MVVLEVVRSDVHEGIVEFVPFRIFVAIPSAAAAAAASHYFVVAAKRRNRSPGQVSHYPVPDYSFSR